MSEERIKLSVKERLLLSNQYRILEALCPSEAEWFEESRLIVENGYELHYGDLNRVILESSLSEEDCLEVMDILDMYRVLKGSSGQTSGQSSWDEGDLQFRGFDGNSDGDRLRYARFLVQRQNRWPEVLDGRPGFDLNSHSSATLATYRRMLQKWIELGKKYELSQEEIKAIVEERVHPDNR